MARSGPPAAEPVSSLDAQRRTLEPLLDAAALLALVRGADACGLLTALRHRTSVDAAARATGLSETRTGQVCDALVAGGVVDRHGSELLLSSDWQVLTSAAAFAPLTPALEMHDVTARALVDLAGRDGFADLPPADRLAYATAVSPNPFSPGVVALVRQGAWTPASLRARLDDTGRHLELGCGVAGRLLCALQASPEMTAVGVELDPDLAAEARRRAERLGVADRFEVLCADAGAVRLDGRFDVVTWSQFFFVDADRPGALATAYVALRPRGLLLAPLLGDDEAAAADPHGPEARNLAMAQVVHGGWGVPARTGAALVAELTAAGFLDVAVSPAAESPIRVAYATRP